MLRPVLRRSLEVLLAATLTLAPGAPARALGEAATPSSEPDRAPSNGLVIDGIAAQVDGKIVLVSEVLRAVRPQEEAMRRAGAPDEEIAKLRADGLERLIESRLVEKIVEDSNQKASDDDIKRTIEGIAKENGLTVEQLYASVVFHGLTVEEYKQQIKRDFERRNLVQGMLGSRVKVEDQEIEALYSERYGKHQETGESVHVRQILRAYGGASQRTQD